MRTAVTELLRALLLEFNCSVKEEGEKKSSEPAGSEILLKFYAIYGYNIHMESGCWELYFKFWMIFY